MTDTNTLDIAELERRIRVVKIAVLKRQRAEGADTLMWSDPAYPEYCRRGRRLVAEMQEQVEKLKADKVAAMTRTAQPIVVDTPRGSTIEARPLPNGWWRAVAGYTYSGLSGLHAVDAGIGDRAYAHEALLIALAKVREGAVDVIEKRFWSDVPATLTRQAEEILAFCDGRTRLIMEHPSTAPAKGRKKAPVADTAENPRPARKPRRHAPDPVTDADRATAIVMQCLKDRGPPGAPLPILRIVAAELVRSGPGRKGFGDGAEAEVELFDGLTARYQCLKFGSETDNWHCSWSRMEGGPIMFENGAWKRAFEPEAEAA